MRGGQSKLTVGVCTLYPCELKLAEARNLSEFGNLYYMRLWSASLGLC